MIYLKNIIEAFWDPGSQFMQLLVRFAGQILLIFGHGLKLLAKRDKLRFMWAYEMRQLQIKQSIIIQHCRPELVDAHLNHCFTLPNSEDEFSADESRFTLVWKTP